MTGMVRTFIELPEIEAIREMLSEEIKKPRKEKEYLLEEEEKDICTEEELVSGLTEGLDGVLFPSFFHGEGGWLYSMLRRNYPGKIPYIMLNGREDSDGGC